jgi:hypothetical protein
LVTTAASVWRNLINLIPAGIVLVRPLAAAPTSSPGSADSNPATNTGDLVPSRSTPRPARVIAMQAQREEDRRLMGL